MGDEESPVIHIVRDRLVYENDYGDLYDDDVEFRPKGIRGRYVRWEWRAPYSVAVLPFADPETVLLLRNFRHSARREVVEAVKGFGDEAREPAEVAVAELREELGFTAHHLDFLGVTVTDPGFACHPLHCFAATGQIDAPRRPEQTETIGGAVRFPLSRTPQALATGEIQDSVTLMLLWQAWHGDDLSRLAPHAMAGAPRRTDRAGCHGSASTRAWIAGRSAARAFRSEGKSECAADLSIRRVIL